MDVRLTDKVAIVTGAASGVGLATVLQFLDSDVGGVIAVDARGMMAAPFNTPGMYRGHRFSDGSTGVWIWSEDHSREAAAH